MYTELEGRIIVREIARASGVLSRAAKALREDYAAFPTITRDTLRRIRKKTCFPEMLQEQKQILSEAIVKGELEAEKSRARLEAAGGQLSRRIVLSGVRRFRDGAFDADDDRELKYKQLTVLRGFVRESSAL